MNEWRMNFGQKFIVRYHSLWFSIFRMRWTKIYYAENSMNHARKWPLGGQNENFIWNYNLPVRLLEIFGNEFLCLFHYFRLQLATDAETNHCQPMSHWCNVAGQKLLKESSFWKKLLIYYYYWYYLQPHFSRMAICSKWRRDLLACILACNSTCIDCITGVNFDKK